MDSTTSERGGRSVGSRLGTTRATEGAEGMSSRGELRSSNGAWTSAGGGSTARRTAPRTRSAPSWFALFHVARSPRARASEGMHSTAPSPPKGGSLSLWISEG
eukprot:1731977-Alexandrium_andersonii.AAC.1